MRNKNKERIKLFNIVPISQLPFSYSNISKFSSLLDIWKWSLWNQLNVCLSAVANSNNHIAPIPWTQDFSSFQTLVSCQTELTLQNGTNALQKKKKKKCCTFQFWKASIDLILPLFTVSVEGAAPLCSNSQPDQSTVAVAPVGMRSWDSFPCLFYSKYSWLQVPTSCYLQCKDFGP